MSTDVWHGRLTRRWLAALVGLGFTAIVTVNLLTLSVYPPPTCDEAVYASNAHSLMRDRTFGLTLFPAGDPYFRDRNMVHMGRLLTILHVLVYSVFGLSWITARAMALLGWLLAAVLTLLVGHLAFGRQIGLAAAALFATSIKAFLTGHTARPEIWAAVAVLGALLGLLVLLRYPRRPIFATGVGFAAVVAVDFHGYVAVFLLAFCTVALVEFGFVQRDWRNLFGYACGVVLGVTGWLAIHLLPVPEEAIYQLAVGYRQLGNLPLSSSPLRNLLGLGEWFVAIFWTAGKPLALLEAVLAAGGVVVALRQRSPEDRVLLVVIAVSQLAFGLAMTQRFVQYGVLWSPLYLLLGARALNELLSGQLRRFALLSDRKLGVYAAVSASLVAVNLVGGLWLVHGFRGGEFRSMLAEMRASVPQGARVLADSPWWWALRENHTFLDSDYILATAAAMRHEAGGSFRSDDVIRHVFADLRPEYVVVDDAIGCRTDAGLEEALLAAHLERACVLERVIEGGLLGQPDKRDYFTGQSHRVYYCPLSENARAVR